MLGCRRYDVVTNMIAWLRIILEASPTQRDRHTAGYRAIASKFELVSHTCQPQCDTPNKRSRQYNQNVRSCCTCAQLTKFIFTRLIQNSTRPSRLMREPQRDSRTPLARRHTAGHSMLSRRLSSLAPPPTARCPPPPACGPADTGRGGRCRRPGPRGTGRDSYAIRRARAVLSLPEGACTADERLGAPDRSGAGAGGARRRGLVSHDCGKLWPAAGRWNMDRASWAAAGSGSRAHAAEASGDGSGATKGKGGALGARTTLKISPDDAW